MLLGIKNLTILPHCVFVDDCGYNLPFGRPEVKVGRDTGRGCTAKCAANEDET